MSYVFAQTTTQMIAEKVAAFLNKAGDAETITLADKHVQIVMVFIRSYTRGKGFVDGKPNADMEAVIIPVTARYTVNPEQSRQYSTGDYSESLATLTGFTIPELAVLNLYRRRAA